MIRLLLVLCLLVLAVAAVCFGTPADQRDDSEQLAALTDANRVGAHHFSS